MNNIESIFTLGPQGTNCELAAKYWFSKNQKKENITLFPTLEEATKELLNSNRQNIALLSCIVYPDLHTLVFNNLTQLKFTELFIYSTYNMVLASVTGNIDKMSTIYTHPAPVSLAPAGKNVKFVNSNVEAAISCINDLNDGGCITTQKAANDRSLKIAVDYGKVDMGFALHSKF